MARYRLLTKEELVPFEKEFIEYLVVNGITGDEWKTLKEENPEKAERITDLFSDVVFEKILRGVRFLTFIGQQQLFTFQCLNNSIVLVGMKVDQNKIKEETEPIDFTNSELLETYLVNPPPCITVFTTTKEYSKTRESELFDLMENGALMDDGRLFKALAMAL